jgi:hypothetical protein
MKLWIGGEIDKSIADCFRDARKSVERAINNVIANKVYDVALDSLDCVAIIRGDQVFAERQLYSSKKRDMDFRLGLELTQFAAVSDTGRKALLFGLVMRAIELLKAKNGIGIAGLSELEKDLVSIGYKMGWK